MEEQLQMFKDDATLRVAKIPPADIRYSFGDNMRIMPVLRPVFTVVYADCIYEDISLSWVDLAISLLAPGGVIMVQTDYHSLAEYMMRFKEIGLVFVNHAIYVQEWGGTSKRFFPRKHDDILIYALDDTYKFRPDRVQIPKATAGTALDKKGTGLKTPCDVFYDLGNFSTISKERVKGADGKNIRWQKPLKLMDRLLLPFTDVGDWVLDPFMGSGTTGVWCAKNHRNFYGIEYDREVYDLATSRLEEEWHEMVAH